MSDVIFFRGENPLRADKLNLAFSERVYRGGDTMLGKLVLAMDPVNALDAATKQYVDRNFLYSLQAAFLPLTGGTMQGYIALHSDPVSGMQAATKQYVDTKVASVGAGVYLPLTGGTLTGGLFLPADPTGALQASTKQYVDSKASTAGDGKFLPLAGGTLSGLLTLSGPPTVPLHATTKAYVDALVTGSVAGVTSFNTRVGAVVLTSADVTNALTFTPYSAANPSNYQTAAQVTTTLAAYSTTTKANTDYVNVTGDTMTGALTINAPGIYLNAPAGQWATITLNKPSAGMGNQILGYTNGVLRWSISPGDSAGADNFAIGRYNDAGTFVDSPIQINRATGATTILGNLTAGANIYANATIYPARTLTANYWLGGDSTHLYVHYEPGWYWAWARSGGTLQWTANGTSRFTIEANGNTTTTGSAAVNYLRAANGVMSVNGFFSVADNSAYYMGRRSDGYWITVENNTILHQVSPQGDAIVARNLSAVTVYGSSGVFINGEFGFFPVSGVRRFQYGTDWYWDWNNSTGTLLWYNRDRGAQWVMRNDGLCYNATLHVGGIGAYVDYSDERGKADICPATTGLSEVLQLQPIRYRRIRNLSGEIVTDEQEDVGFSAQQVREVIPEAVIAAGMPHPDGSGDIDSDDPSLGMMTTPIIAALVNAVKELHAEVQTLKGEPRVSH